MIALLKSGIALRADQQVLYYTGDGMFMIALLKSAIALRANQQVLFYTGDGMFMIACTLKWYRSQS